MLWNQRETPWKFLKLWERFFFFWGFFLEREIQFVHQTSHLDTRARTKSFIFMDFRLQWNDGEPKYRHAGTIQETGKQEDSCWCAALVSVARLAAHVAAARLRCEDLDFVVVTSSGAVQANFDLKEGAELSRRRAPSPFPRRLSRASLTLASLPMVQQREAEVMLWVKLEATSTEYLEGKALDSQ